MLTSEKDKKICAKYSAYDENHKCRCNECPLTKGDFRQHDFRCKANSHFDRHTGEWEFDDDYYRDKTLDEYIICNKCTNANVCEQAYMGNKSTCSFINFGMSDEMRHDRDEILKEFRSCMETLKSNAIDPNYDFDESNYDLVEKVFNDFIRHLIHKET